MVSREQFELVRELVDDAVAAGATLRCGGPLELSEHPVRFYAPAVLTGVTHDMRIMREEIFGPVVPIVTVESEDEAIALANDSDFGLGASVWTHEPRQGRADRRADPVRHGLDQRPHVQPRRLLLLVGRRQGLRPRPLALEVRALRVRERQARDLGAVAHARLLVAPLRRVARQGDAAPRRACSTAATPTSPPRCGAALFPLLKVGGKTLRDVFRR